MRRTLPAAILVVATAIAGASPAFAIRQSPTVQGYSARPATMPARDTLIVRDRMWRCDRATGMCRGPASTSSPATACSLIAREVGTLAMFEAGGRAFDEAALARCNARAAG